MSRRYAKLDQSTLPANLELQNANLVCTFNTDSTSSVRNARATETLTGGRWTWECATWGTEALTTDNVRFGMLIASVANNVRLGDVTGSISYSPGDGTIKVDNVVVATVAASDVQRWVQFCLDLVSGTQTLTIRLQGLTLYTITLTSGQSWIPAISIGGTTAYDLSGIFNFGEEPLDGDTLDNYKPGIYINTAQGGSMFFASQAHRNAPDGDPPNQQFLGVILNAESVYLESGISFQPDGTSSASFGASDIDLDNEKGALSHLLIDQPRNAPAIFETVNVLDMSVAPVVVGTARVDYFTEPSRGVMRLKLASPLSIYDDPWARKKIPPWSDAGSAGQVWPFLAGVGRNLQPVPYMLNAGMPTYLLNLDPLTAMGTIRDRGDPDDPTADPPDDTMTRDLRGIIRYKTPLGPFTCDASAAGTSRLTPVSPTDLLGGVGDMATASGGAGSMPTGWTAKPKNGPKCNVAQQQTSTGGGRLRVTFSSWIGDASIMANGSNAQAAASLTAGDRYRIEFDIMAFVKDVAHYNSSQLQVKLVDAGGVLYDIPGALWGSADVGHYKQDFTATVNAVAINFSAGVAVVGGTTSATYTVDIDNVTIVQLPSGAGGDTGLEGTTLTDFTQNLIEYKFGQQSTAWVPADAQAIDTAKPYKFGVFSNAAITMRGILRAPYDSLGLCEVPDEFGRWRIASLQDPAGMTPAISVTFARGDTPIGDPDRAKSLTLNATAPYNWYQFTDSDFVDDFDPSTGIDAPTRAAFKRRGQYPIKSAASMPDLYGFAVGAADLNMVLDNPADAQAEMNARGALFEETKINYAHNFNYVWPPSQILRPGLAYNVTCDWGEFTEGKNLLIKKLRHYMLPCQYQISIAWG